MPAGAVRKKPTSAHQIVSGSGDILTRRGRPHHRHGHQQNGGGGKDGGPNRKFSSLVNEYVGNCLEDNCNIGEGRRERADSRPGRGSLGFFSIELEGLVF